LSSGSFMLKVDSTLNHIPAGRNHVIGLHESINQPLVNIPNFGTAPTGAFVLGTRNDQGVYTVFVYLHQSETSAIVVYVSEPRHLTHEQYRVEEAEALRFVESMGFMVDNLHFPTLAPPEQDKVMERIPLFRPPRATLDLYDVQEDNASHPPSIFGGISAQDSALVRQGKPLSGPPTMAPVMGQPAVPPMALRHSALDGQPVSESPPPSTDVEIPAGFVAASGSIPTVTGSMTSPPTSGVMPKSGTPSGPVSGAPAPVRPAPDPDALARLGRLLGTFVLLVAATSGWRCSTTQEAQASRTVVAQLDLGNQQLAQGRWPDAIKAFGTALDEDDSNFDALRGTGLAYLKLQRYKEAERFYRRAIEANPKSSLSRNELAVVYMEQRRCQEAVPLFEKVLEDIFYPTPEFAEHNLAQAYACLGRIDDAISRLDKLVTKRPYFCLGYLTLSQLASKSRRPEATIRACDDFVHHCEQNEKIKQQVLPQQSAMCYLRKGLAYAEMGDVESARTSFERCQSLGEVGNECTKSLELLPQ
ncbi:MAG: tetratricopeptide repeat protein, partial [Myxococcota bacterium]